MTLPDPTRCEATEDAAAPVRAALRSAILKHERSVVAWSNAVAVDGCGSTTHTREGRRRTMIEMARARKEVESLREILGIA